MPHLQMHTSKAKTVNPNISVMIRINRLKINDLKKMNLT